MLSTGAGQVLRVTFTPDDAINIASVTAQTQLTVKPAPLTITADDKTMVEGGPMPVLTASYSGLVNGDTPSSLNTRVSLATSATPQSPKGSYTITVMGGSAVNYTIIHVNGTLTVQAVGKELTAEHGTTGCPGSTFVFVARGFTPGATVVIDVDGRVVLRATSDSAGSLRFALIIGDIAPAGTYTIGATGEALGIAPSLAQRVSTTVRIDPTATCLMLPPDSDLPTVNALPTVYLLLTYR